MKNKIMMRNNNKQQLQNNHNGDNKRNNSNKQCRYVSVQYYYDQVNDTTPAKDNNHQSCRYDVLILML